MRPTGFTGENEDGGVPDIVLGEDCLGPNGSMFRNDLNFGMADGALGVEGDEGLCPMSHFAIGAGEGEILVCLTCAGCDGLPSRCIERGDGSKEKAERPNELARPLPFDAFRGTGAAMTGM